MKPLTHQPAKKKATSNPVIPQKLSYKKSEKELNAAVQKDVDSFFEKVKSNDKRGRTRRNRTSTYLQIFKKEGEPEKTGISKDPAKIGLRKISHQVIGGGTEKD